VASRYLDVLLPVRSLANLVLNNKCCSGVSTTKDGNGTIKVQRAGDRTSRAASGVIVLAPTLDAGRPTSWLLRAGEEASARVGRQATDRRRTGHHSHSAGRRLPSLSCTCLRTAVGMYLGRALYIARRAQGKGELQRAIRQHTAHFQAVNGRKPNRWRWWTMYGLVDKSTDTAHCDDGQRRTMM
ncbi:hypothetical protein CH063_05088, partial [Colletotrichum higginsianum]